MRVHEATHGVYFDDLDAMQILHNSRYLILFERAVGSLFASLGWGGLLDAQRNPDQYHLVRANQIEYLRPVTEVGSVRVQVWVQKLGRSSLVFGLRVLPLKGDAAFATGTRTIVRVDPESRKPVPWTDAFREALAPYVGDTPGL